MLITMTCIAAAIGQSMRLLINFNSGVTIWKKDRRMELGHMQTPAVIFCTTDPPNVDPNLTIVHHNNNPLSRTQYKPKISQFNTVLKVVICQLAMQVFIFDTSREYATLWRVLK